ncbi:MAG: patatin-like phospholipase family protein [Candidatus Zhuqueibacterota bacterium]
MCGTPIIFGKTATDDTVRLQFGKIDYPPFCFFPHKFIERPTIGLALSGGGARGFAQIGAIQVLEENNIPIDVIVGTSMGSIIGGLYAAGYSPQQIESLAKSIDWSNLMVDTPPRSSLFIGQKQERSRTILQIRFKGLHLALPQAVTPGQKLTSILTNLTLKVDYQTNSDFDKLKIPFRALACDLISGQKILLRNGNLAEAMKASSAVPLLFAPVPRDSMLLVDGGLINNIPVDDVRENGADLVLAVDTASKLRPENKIAAPWEIADQVTTIMQKEKLNEQRDKADVLIKVDLNDYKSDSFQKVDNIIEAGRNETIRNIYQIQKLIQHAQTDSVSKTPLKVKDIHIAGIEDNSLKDIVLNIMNIKLGKMASRFDIANILKDTYETGYFENALAICRTSHDSLSINFIFFPNPHFCSAIFKGNTVFPDSILKRQLGCRKNLPINYLQSKEDIANIIRLYKSNGYALVQIDDIHIKNDTLFIDINEGQISSISIEGNERSKDFVILREFPLKPGDIFNLNKADDGINNIHSTNLFETVSLEVDRKNQLAHIVIKVRERAFSLLRFSYHHDLDRKNKALIELADENIFGSGNQLMMHSVYGPKEQRYSLTFRADRLFRSFITNDFNAFHSRENNYVYHEGNRTGEYQQQDYGFSFSLGQQIKRLGVFSAIASLNEIRLSPLNGFGYPTGKYALKTLTIQSIVDTQDRYPFPQNGKYYRFFYKMSSATFLNSEISFIKLFTSLDLYHTFLKRNTLHPKIIWGTSDLTTPFFEQYRLGGQNTFYGLYENEKIGRHIIVGSLEYRYLFPFAFPVDVYWSMRYDLGATWENSVDINPTDFNAGFGTSLDISTPVGPFSIAIGKIRSGQKVFYFSAGFNF